MPRPKGWSASYIHAGGKIGVLVEINCESDFVARTEDFQRLCHDVAMHIAALDPRFLRREEVTQEILDREREIYAEQAKATGKPEPVIEKIVNGKMEKFYEENCLYEQHFIKDEGDHGEGTGRLKPSPSWAKISPSGGSRGSRSARWTARPALPRASEGTETASRVIAKLSFLTGTSAYLVRKFAGHSNPTPIRRNLKIRCQVVLRARESPLAEIRSHLHDNVRSHIRSIETRQHQTKRRETAGSGIPPHRGEAFRGIAFGPGLRLAFTPARSRAWRTK